LVTKNSTAHQDYIYLEKEVEPMRVTPKNRREFLERFAVGAVAVPAAMAAGSPVFADAADTEMLQAQTDLHLPKYIFDVREFGARGDGKTINTQAIQAAVDACAKAGGGKVVVPAGKFLSGPIMLKSNMEFEVVAGGTLMGSANFEDYPTMRGRWEGLERTMFASLLTGEGLENISITGQGVLDGQGGLWWDAHRKTLALRRTAGLVDREPENPAGSPLRWPRPRMIYLSRSKNILVRGLTLVNSPSWNIHPVLCENVRIDGVSIINPGDSPNTDGIDPDSCKNVRISNCYISTGDDCIIIKSGYKHIPGKPYGPSENIMVTNCVFGLGHCGVGVGSETAGGVRNVAISNCICDGTTSGLRFKTARSRGEVVEDIRATNVVMRGIKDAAIFVGMFYDNGDKAHALQVNEFTPTFRNFHFSDIVVHGAKSAISVEGLLENPVQSLSLRNMVATSTTGVSVSGVRGASFENLAINPDGGPPFSFKDAEDLEVVRARTSKANGDLPVITLERVHGAAVESCTAAAGNSALIKVVGRENTQVSLALNRPPAGATEVAYADGASADVVTRRA
jgi:polygalacturonase